MLVLGELTTTTVRLWQADCENFRNTGELRDVSTEEHRHFIEAFAARYDLRVKHGNGVAVFKGTGKVRPNQFSEVPSVFRVIF